MPFTRHIAPRWSNTFRNVSIDFKSFSLTFEDEVALIVSERLTEVEESATPLLKDLAQAQAERSRKTVRQVLPRLMRRVKSIVGEKQKEVSRDLAPRIQEMLKPGYEVAAPQSGPGSSARRKVHRVRSIQVPVSEQSLTDAVS